MSCNLRKLNMSRLLALLLALTLLFGGIPAAFAAETGAPEAETGSSVEISGTCGDNLSWSLDGDTLTITGSGPMYDYPERTMAPWYPYRENISTVHLPDGLTRVGDLAFYNCTALESVFLPDSVTEVGWHAFSGCTSMTMLKLSSSLQAIEDGGFRECTSLPSVRLPNTMTSIGYQGFYRCEALTEITIPASVTELGMTAFAFCYQLVRANVQAQITVLPDWTFYGCGRLTDISLPSTLTGVDEFAFYDCTSLANVEYTGSDANLEQIKADIDRDLEGKSGMTSVSDSNNGDSSTNSVFEETESGMVSNTTTTGQTDNASISTNVTVTYPVGSQGSSSAQVDVTLENSEGWNEVTDKVTEIVDYAQSTNVDVYIKDDSLLPGDAMTGLAGKNVTVTVHTPTGSVWKIDCTTLEVETEQDAYDLSYESENATEAQLEKLGCAVGYQIRFTADAQVNAEVMIKLPAEHARKNATLYQRKLGGGLDLIQTVVVDDEGYAHFYLGSVDRQTEYLIGIDVPGEQTQEAIVPEVLYDDYGLDTVSSVEYVVTGRTSSWGMTINQVTWILAGVLLASVVIVGLVMFSLNKRRLKMGYVPDLDEEDYE